MQLIITEKPGVVQALTVVCYALELVRNIYGKQEWQNVNPVDLFFIWAFVESQ